MGKSASGGSDQIETATYSLWGRAFRETNLFFENSFLDAEIEAGYS